MTAIDLLHIGQKVSWKDQPYYICGLSTMVYDEDCTGEPEWKITKEIQEVALVEPFNEGNEREFHKPHWVGASEVKPHPITVA